MQTAISLPIFEPSLPMSSRRMRMDSLLALKAVSKLSVSKTSSGLRSCVEIENRHNWIGVWHRAGWRTRRTAKTQNEILRTPWRSITHTTCSFDQRTTPCLCNSSYYRCRSSASFLQVSAMSEEATASEPITIKIRDQVGSMNARRRAA